MCLLPYPAPHPFFSVPHEVATGKIHESEALKHISREQLDTLVAHSKERAAFAPRKPPPMKLEKA